MQCHSVELRAEFHKLKPIGSISPVFCGRITGYTWRAFFGSCSCSALCTFKSDNNSNTFALSHENKIAIKTKLAGLTLRRSWRRVSCNPSLMTRISHRIEGASREPSNFILPPAHAGVA